MAKTKPHLPLALLAALSLMLGLILSACGDATATTAPAVTTAAPVATTAAPVATTAAPVATTAAPPVATTAAPPVATPAAPVVTTAAPVVTTAPATAATTTVPATAATTASAAPAFSGGFTPSTLSGLNTIKIPDTLKVGPGVDKDKKTIKLGMLIPLSGPVGPFGKIQLGGFEAYFKALNDAGGISGYKVELVPGDTAYSPQQAIQQYNKISGDVAMLGVIFGTPIVQALKESTRNDKIIASGSTFDSSILQEKYVYLVATPYPLEAINGIDYAVKELAGKNKKFALVHQDDGYGEDVKKGYLSAMKTYGLTDVGMLPFKVGDQSFTSQASQLKSAGAEVILLASQPSETAKIIGAAAQGGVDANYLLMSPAFNIALLNTPIKDILVSKAFVINKGVPWGEPSAPGSKPLLDAVAKYSPEQKPDAYYSFGWAQSVVITNILGRALEKGDISRDGLLAALESLKNVDMGGLLPNISFGTTPDERVPSRESVILKIDPNSPSKDGTTPITKSLASEAAKAYKVGG